MNHIYTLPDLKKKSSLNFATTTKRISQPLFPLGPIIHWQVGEHICPLLCQIFFVKYILFESIWNHKTLYIYIYIIFIYIYIHIYILYMLYILYIIYMYINDIYIYIELYTYIHIYIYYIYTYI